MAELFTPAEANTLYNRCKIAYDPRSYSLKDGLKLNMHESELNKHHIVRADFGAESALVAAIHEFHKQPNGEAYVKNIFLPAKTHPGDSANYFGTHPADVALCKKDDMYIALDYMRALGYIDTVLKVGGALEAIAQTCVALSSPKSCTADLHWLVTEFADREYEDLHNFKHLTEALETKAEVIPAYVHRSAALCQMAPAVSVYTKHKGALLASGFDTADAKHIDEHVITCNLYSAMFYMLEVFWAIESLPDPKFRRIMYEHLLKKQPMAISEMLGMFVDIATLTLHHGIDGLVHIANPKDRFEHYREYAKAAGFEAIAKDLTAKFLSGDPAALLPAGAGTLVGFAQTYSNTWVRVNTCKILYEYAMANNLLDDEDCDLAEVQDGMEDIATHGGSGSSTFSTPAEKESSDLMDLKIGSKSSVGGIPGAGAYTSPTYEALDKAKSKYVDGRYEFETVDVVNFSDSARTKYEAIAKKVSLVNRVLTQKIREIKTYNTGGKQAGLSSGRVDRKAVYRYKYDGNIFYNNTYKQLESDLAFGIVLDISGSMWGSGIENGRVTMIVLHETLKALGINHSIIGHTSHGRYKCNIERYQAFREDKTYHTRKNYALTELEAQNGNCDSASLYYMERALLRTKNRDKICIIFSDGQPTECTGTDLKEQVAHMNRNGIKVIGIGINFPEIADYYKDYANGKNLTDMLNIVTNILKEYILKKKERA